MNDVSLNAIEEDLVHGSNIVLPRIMQRLLYTVSYDRKVSLSNWQTALRKQYRKRDPAANPIGPEPRVDELDQASSPSPEEYLDDIHDESKDHEVEDSGDNVARPSVNPDEILESTRASTADRALSIGASVKGFSLQPSELDLKQSSLGDDPTQQEESKNWLDLPMLTKLDSMHILTEWQFQNALRLRTLMRSDDENASWRIEPIGYDSKSNAYWLIGGKPPLTHYAPYLLSFHLADRIWLQRPIPKPPRNKATNNAASLKRKRSAKTVPKDKGRSAPTPAPKRQRLHVEEPVGRGRAAKAQAKVKLDAQAKELEELNRQAKGLRSSARGRGVVASTSPVKQAVPAPTGTRVSARLRGREDEHEWQAVPDEWLNDVVITSTKANGRRGPPKKQKTGLESDASDISDLTELTEENDGDEDLEDDEDEDQEPEPEEQPVYEQGETKPAIETCAPPVDDRGLESPPISPEGFIEWETICVTLHEWEHIAERFEKATHYTEKALYKVLVNNIVPIVVEELREIERKEKLSTAITQRKRSSRLLLRQSEKEEAEAAERKRREEEERNSRAKRQEARAKKEEAERERREMARELRRREREEREEKEKAAEANGGAIATQRHFYSSEMLIDVVGDGSAAHEHQPKYATNGKVSNIGTSGSKTPVGDDWELDCEICNRRGINWDDGTPMMSCGICSKWQHIACHDLADQQAGRQRRNWDLVEFFCLQCQKRRTSSSRTAPPQPHFSSSMGQPQVHTPYISQHSITSLAQASHYTDSGYPHAVPVSMNGDFSYSRDTRMSSTRPPVPSIPQPSQVSRQQSQHYGTPISFTHYQPQQRGFSSTAEPFYGQSSHTQSYGYAASQNQYSQYPAMNGNVHSYHQPSPARWDPSNTSSQRSTSEHSTAGPTPYNATGAGHTSAASHYGHPGPATTQTTMHWQQQPHHPPPTTHNGTPPQLNRYPPNSYQPAPS
ncbi:hypothetical protein H0H81_002416 [Sphagnurus paluster]|uniref:Zinc finger PHD-type domain-containing protein n=1 Tax=Sphagnurus paluster TaxID=117069 RepID=A0A9P7FZH7_9AGAR|nr:hypothetical protein H0H81_002416 [Sphagnurus paluster]